MVIFFPRDDVVYSGSEFRSYMAPRKSGVYSATEHFSATTSGNVVNIDTGIAWMKFDKLKGGSFTIDEPMAIPVPDITGSQIARLFFTADIFLNTESVAFRVGANANDPNIQPIRTNTVQELAPYDVKIVDGLYVLVDNRGNEELCGLMKSESDPGTGGGDMTKAQFATNPKAGQGFVDKAITADGLTDTLAVEDGGTGAKTASAARTALGVPATENVLTKDNTTPYTPTEDNHPATRKFVLDNAGGGGSAKRNTLYVGPASKYTSAQCDYLTTGTDDARVIGQAIDVARQTGQILHIRAGTYDIYETIGSSLGFVHIQGGGPFIWDGEGGTIFRLRDGGFGFGDGVIFFEEGKGYIEGIVFDGGSNAVPLAASAIVDGGGSIITNCAFKNFPTPISTSPTTLAVNNIILDPGQGWEVGRLDFFGSNAALSLREALGVPEYVEAEIAPLKTNSGWQTLTLPEGLTGSVKYRKYSNDVEVSIDIGGVERGATSVALGYLPEGFRPEVGQYFVGYANSTTIVMSTLSIDFQSGLVRILAAGNTTTVLASVMYKVAGA